MLQKLHQNAKTNYAIRRQIKQSPLPVAVLARKFNLSWSTIKKWKQREDVEDKSSRPDHLRTSLTPYHEDGVYYFGVPTSLIEPEMLFYIHASDIKNGTVSTPIRSIFRVSLKKNEDAYAVTFPIIEINKHTPPIKFVGIEDAPQFPQILFSKHNRSYFMLGAK